MLNIVVPMAGRGQRFKEVGYDLPKPLIPIHGVPMIKVVIDNVRPRTPHRFVFIVLREHLQPLQPAGVVAAVAPGAGIVALDGVTEGAACTVLQARAFDRQRRSADDRQ